MSGDVSVNVDPELVARYREACAKRDAYDEIAQRYKADVIQALKVGEDEWANHALVDGEPVLAYVQTHTTRLDTKRLRKEWPQVYADFSVTKPSTSLRWVA